MYKSEKILLIDGHSLLFRAFFAGLQMPDKRFPHQPTNAVYIFIRMIRKFLTQPCPYQEIIVAFDERKDTLRKKKLPSYKANRKRTPPGLISQIPILKEYLRSIKIRFFSHSDYEADDIIGTLASTAESINKPCDVLTSDQDLFQLVSDLITILHVKKGVKNLDAITPHVLKTQFGLKAQQIPDYKALVGDSSDNLKGVTGIGPQTAKILLAKYHDINDIYQNITTLPAKIQHFLKNDKQQALQTLSLTKINRHVPISCFETFHDWT